MQHRLEHRQFLAAHVQTVKRVGAIPTKVVTVGRQALWPPDAGQLPLWHVVCAPLPPVQGAALEGVLVHDTLVFGPPVRIATRPEASRSLDATVARLPARLQEVLGHCRVYDGPRILGFSRQLLRHVRLADATRLLGIETFSVQFRLPRLQGYRYGLLTGEMEAMLRSPLRDVRHRAGTRPAVATTARKSARSANAKRSPCEP
mmetsp:Transcript_9011/g.25115  ORF Transcript_9011/g.25115 Transcript_9011/m.25115 type:complete len:203 (+) Transcript_9011:338-946(+)